MTEQAVLKALESRGSAQNRKIYRRHGVKGEMWGVSYADLDALKKKIKTNHELALGLWQSGNHDARVLATMVADPAQLSRRVVDAWAKELDNYMLTDAFSKVVSRSPVARDCVKRWTVAKDEWKGSAGWTILSLLALDDPDIEARDLEPHLKTIETTIHGEENRVRYSMNNALIAIGARSAALEKKALAVARKIGAVQVDHGETGCKTPNAAAYIPKARARQAKRMARS